MKKNVTKVVFRKYKKAENWDGGGVIALFPEQPERNYCINSYMHIGQHGPCALGIIGQTRLATAEEYDSLKKELEGLGYNLKINKRMKVRF
jgi:hypothetical protein